MDNKINNQKEGNMNNNFYINKGDDINNRNKSDNNIGGKMNNKIYKIGITESGDAGLDFTWDSQEYKNMPRILVTKAPHAILNYIKNNGIEKYNNIIIHCTITGFGNTIIEPGVASPDITLKAYNELIELFGGERVILRVDPIVLSDKGEETAINIIKNRKGRLRISFLDMYPHVLKRLQAAGITPPYTTFHAPLEKRLKFVEKIRHLGISDGSVEVCGEPDMDCTGCVSIRDINALKLDIELYGYSNQRSTCHCVANKTELLNNKFRCPHKCIYCYWHDKPENTKPTNTGGNVKEIYCDSGKRGSGSNINPTRIRVTDENGNDILDVANATYNGHRVYEFKDLNITNNFGELVAMTIALRLANKYNVKIIKTDSQVVGLYWVKGQGKELKKYYDYYIKHTKPQYEKFIQNGGNIVIISGDINKADLGDHI